VQSIDACRDEPLHRDTGLAAYSKRGSNVAQTLFQHSTHHSSTIAFERQPTITFSLVAQTQTIQFLGTVIIVSSISIICCYRLMITAILQHENTPATLDSTLACVNEKRETRGGEQDGASVRTKVCEMYIHLCNVCHAKYRGHTSNVSFVSRRQRQTAIYNLW
jgi:hypothetical protein